MTSDVDNNDPSLQFANFKQLDHTISCPIYTSILKRKSGCSSICISADEDLSYLEEELGDLLENVSHRMRGLEQERQLLVDWMEHNALSGNDKHLLSDKSFTNKLIPVKKKIKTDVQSKLKVNKHLYDSEISSLELPISRFWSEVNEFCRDITSEDCGVLENLLKSSRSRESEERSDKDSSLCLTAFAKSWIGDPNASQTKPGKHFPSKSNGFNSLHEDSTRLGRLTVELLQSLVSNKSKLLVASTTGDNQHPSKQRLAHGISARHSSTLEHRIRDELITQGFLDSDSESEEKTTEHKENPFVGELNRLKREWEALQGNKRELVGRALDLAQTECRRSQLRDTGSLLDDEVLEHYSKTIIAKQRKKPLSKKEVDMAWKSLREREAVYRLVDCLTSKSLKSSTQSISDTKP